MLLKSLSQVAPLMTDLFFFRLAEWHVGSSFLGQGSNLQPLHWKCGALTTGQPGKSPTDAFCFTDHDLNFRVSFLLHSWSKALLLHQFEPLHMAAPVMCPEPSHMAAPLMCPEALTISARSGLRSQLHTGDQGDCLLGRRGE